MRAEESVAAGWDIGGVNVKLATLAVRQGAVQAASAVVRPFEVWRDPAALTRVLDECLAAAGVGPAGVTGVTMTAELSDVFRSRREGVLYVLDAVEAVTGGGAVRVLDTAGRLVPLAEIRGRPLEAAATNWVASALLTAERVADCVLVDVGSTTTDVIPLRGGHIAARGRTDADRLLAGELVYTGVLRTNPNTFAASVPLRGGWCRVAAEWFTQTADVYVALGRLSPELYTCPTPDGRGTAPAEARARLARLVCEDAEVQTEAETMAVARYLASRQAAQIADGLTQVLAAQGGAPIPLLAAGLGGFLVPDVARLVGTAVLEEPEWGAVDPVALPAGAVAVLAAREAGLLERWT
jgi:probable H4MPT-linked C1 transfer pathway protein